MALSSSSSDKSDSSKLPDFFNEEVRFTGLLLGDGLLLDLARAACSVSIVGVAYILYGIGGFNILCKILFISSSFVNERGVSLSLSRRL